ncbi:MAG: hypothetical protein AMS18_07400 [Gemmatimonas sp. SG8_17]|nr:MAG: hypothetical protein AMS18_07400 [Gemmatimonas sp. SG8_17]
MFGDGYLTGQPAGLSRDTVVGFSSPVPSIPLVFRPSSGWHDDPLLPRCGSIQSFAAGQGELAS